MGARCCVGDYDNDGWEDLYVTYYGKYSVPHNGNGTFTDVSDKPAWPAPAKPGDGCAFIDYDRDGHLDLMVSNYVDFDYRRLGTRRARQLHLERRAGDVRAARLPGSRNILYHNRGNGR